ncbi:MAG: hypothetical protein V4714_00115 [Bacteroidota bacterium]
MENDLQNEQMINRCTTMMYCIEAQIKKLQKSVDPPIVTVFNMISVNQLRVLYWELEVELKQRQEGKVNWFTPSFGKMYLHSN